MHFSRNAILALPFLAVALTAPTPAPAAALEARSPGLNLNGLNSILGALAGSTTSSSAAATATASGIAAKVDPYSQIKPILADLKSASDSFSSDETLHMCKECATSLQNIFSSVQRAESLIAQMASSPSGYTTVTTGELASMAASMADSITTIASGISMMKLTGGTTDTMSTQLIAQIDKQMADVLDDLDVLASGLSDTVAPLVFAIVTLDESWLPKTTIALGMGN